MPPKEDKPVNGTGILSVFIVDILLLRIHPMSYLVFPIHSTIDLHIEYVCSNILQ